MFETIVPIAVMCAVAGIYLVIFGLHGRVVDPDAKLCRQCGFDVRGVPTHRCPECGADVSSPLATATGRRGPQPWAIAVGLALLLPAVGGFVTKKVFQVKGITAMRFLSEGELARTIIVPQEPRRTQDAIDELERRFAAQSLSEDTMLEFVPLWLDGYTSSGVSPWPGDPEHQRIALAQKMLFDPAFPASERNALFDQWLDAQASESGGRWSVVWGDTLASAHGLGLLSDDRFERFMENGLKASIHIDSDPPIHPGDRVWVSLRWTVRLGDVFIPQPVFAGLSAVVSVPGLDEWCYAPRVTVLDGYDARIGRITVPDQPGVYRIEGTVGVSLAGPLHSLETAIPSEKPDLTEVEGLDTAFRVSCEYTVEPAPAGVGAAER